MKNTILIAIISMTLCALTACFGEAIGTQNINDNQVNQNNNQVVVVTPQCGNRVVEVGEECDGNPVTSDTSCQDLGFDGGQVGCYHDCTIDTSKCVLCGDGNAAGAEACDGEDLRYQTCRTRGYDGGVLACRADCGGFDESGCYNNPVQPSGCGNGVIEVGELCDGTAINDTCQTAGWDGGTLRCMANCLVYDASDCYFED